MSDGYRLARERMVREQLVPRGIIDRKVLRAMRTVPRHLFVPEGLRNRAYGDHPLPIGEGQTISQPFIVALMTQALELVGTEKVLEIGTGSGYQAAVLAEIVPRVLTIERVLPLGQAARRTLEALGYHQVAVKVIDGTLGWKDEAPFDGILVAAGSPAIPESLLGQLADGGRLVIPVGSQLSQSLVRVTREGDAFREEDLGGCVFVPLIGREGWPEASR